MLSKTNTFKNCVVKISPVLYVKVKIFSIFKLQRIKDTTVKPPNGGHNWNADILQYLRLKLGKAEVFSKLS